MSSDLDTILNALVDGVTALGFTLDDEAIPAYKGKLPTSREDLNPPVQFIISKSETPERMTRFSFTKKRTDYTIDITLIAPHTGPIANLIDHAYIRQTLLDAFDKPPLAGAPDVFEMRSNPKEFLDREAQSKEWDEQTIEVTTSIVSNL